MYPKCTHVLMFDALFLYLIIFVIVIMALFLYLFIFVIVIMGLSAFMPRLKGENRKLAY